MTLEIDWRNPVELPASRRVHFRQRRDDRERLARCKFSKGPKKHSVNRERSREESAKARKGKIAASKQARERAAFMDAARAYWRGEANGYPEIPRR